MKHFTIERNKFLKIQNYSLVYLAHSYLLLNTTEFVFPQLENICVGKKIPVFGGKKTLKIFWKLLFNERAKKKIGEKKKAAE